MFRPALLTAITAALVLLGCGYEELPDGKPSIPDNVIMGVEKAGDMDLFSSWNMERGWDLNSRTEDRAAGGPYFFEKWDTQNDNFLTSEEVAEGVFRHYGGDDGVVTREEFLGSHEAPGETAVFATWDDNHDGTLSRDEFSEGARLPLIAALWDSNNDGLISSIEIQTRFFQSTDVDGDGTIEAHEWSL